MWSLSDINVTLNLILGILAIISVVGGFIIYVKVSLAKINQRQSELDTKLIGQASTIQELKTYTYKRFAEIDKSWETRCNLATTKVSNDTNRLYDKIADSELKTTKSINQVHREVSELKNLLLTNFKSK